VISIKPCKQEQIYYRIIKLEPVIDHQKESIFQFNIRQEQKLIRSWRINKSENLHSLRNIITTKITIRPIGRQAALIALEPEGVINNPVFKHHHSQILSSIQIN
jgi:hypothetical protein